MLNALQLRIEIQRSVAAALAEDVGTGDLTARLIPLGTDARGRVITREAAVMCPRCGHKRGVQASVAARRALHRNTGAESRLPV